MILDGHVHVGPWKEPSFSGRATDLAHCVEVLRESGIGGALVMPTDRAENEGLLAALRAWEGQRGGADPILRFNAWVDPLDPGNLPWLEAHAREIAALKIHPSFVRKPPTDPVYEPHLDAAAAHGWPVLVHCGRWQEMSSWRFGVELARRHPTVSFVLCHMGGDSTDLVQGVVDALSAEDGPRNAWLGTESIRQYWIVGAAIERLGADRVIFGSDYNLNHPRSFLAVVEALHLPKPQAQAVLGDNLDGLLPEALRFSKV